jgi:hypothetical protein
MTDTGDDEPILVAVDPFEDKTPETAPKQKGLNPWPIIDSINRKNYAFDPETMTARKYPLFIITKSFSFFRETVMLANEVNSMDLKPKMHYDFLFYSIPKLPPDKKRISKWFKQDLELEKDIAEYYEISLAKAKEILTLLTNDQVEELKDLLSKGGIS